MCGSLLAPAAIAFHRPTGEDRENTPDARMNTPSPGWRKALIAALQRALDDSDALNEWTTAIGSAVFAVPPGYAKGGWVGETLLG